MSAYTVKRGHTAIGGGVRVGGRVASLHFLPSLQTAFTATYTLRTGVPPFLRVFLLHIVRRASPAADI